MSTANIPERSQLRPEDQWNLGDLYPSDEAWQADFDAAKALAAKLPSYRGRLGSSARTLLEFARLDEEIGLLLNYAQRKNDEDTRVAAYQAMAAKATALWVDISAAGAFETPELLAIPEETLEDFYRQEPDLELYRRSFWNVRRRRAHILSDPEEQLLAQAGEMAQAPDTIFSMFNDADLRFEDAVDSAGVRHPLSQSTFASREESGLFQAVMALPERHRTALYLFYYEDLSVREIAELLRISETAVTTRLSRARRALRQVWREDAT